MSENPGEFERWFDLSTDLLAVVGADGLARRLSASWTHTLGYSMDMLLSRPLVDFIHPDDRADTLERVVGHESEAGNIRGFINRYVHADGSSRWLEWNAHTVGAGQVIYAVARDVTERQRRSQHAASWAAALLAVLSARTLDEILPVVANQARLLIGVHQSAICLIAAPACTTASTVVSLSPENDAWRGVEDPGDSGHGDSGHGNSSLYAEVRRTNKPMRLTQEALEAHPLWSEFAAAVAGFPPMRGWLAVPMMKRAGHNLGLIQLSDKVDGSEFDAEDEHRLTELARLASLTIERSLSQTQAAAALAQQQLVVALGQSALSQEPLDQVLTKAVVEVAALLGVSTVAVVEVAVGPNEVLTTPLAGVPAGMPAYAFTHEQFYSSSAAVAIRLGKPVATEDYDEQPSALGAEVIAKHGLRSAVSVAMTGGSFNGVLYAADAEPLRFGEREIGFLQQVANVLSSAIAQSWSQQRVLHQATHDALTGLPNRGVLRSTLEERMNSAAAAGERTGLLLLDLDGFKDVNDSLGHAAGDLVLEQLAVRLAGAAGEGGLVARLGGDEFAVCFAANTSAAQLQAAAERLMDALLTPFDVEGLDVPLSASMGLVIAPDHGGDASTLLRHADVAMYRAKATRTGWALFDDGLDHARAVRLTSISELRRAIRGGHLELHYQPIVDLQNSQSTAVEALVRWRHATRGLIQPVQFIALAEQSGLIGELTAWVIDRAVADVTAWREQGRTLRCAVNLSVEALTHVSIAHDLMQRVIDHREIITVEITESALADSRVTRTLRELAAAGVSCAIDDFGTGYSSLAALKSLPVSTVKIDREFVRDLDRSSQDFAIIQSVSQLAAALSLGVIAEGVETLATAQRLEQAGIRLAQGYYFARPMPAGDVQAWFHANEAARPVTPS